MTESIDDLRERLLREEHDGWQAILDGRAGTYYANAMTDDALMIVERLVLDRRSILHSFDDVAPWDYYEIHEPTVIRLGANAAVLAYRATARRGDITVDLRMTTTYLDDDGVWRIAAHQQTPA